MIFITGPMFAGKKDVACDILGCDKKELHSRAVWEAQNLAFGCESLEALADRLAERELVISTEIGCGIVPENAVERAERENAGRLACLLAERAELVIRVFCGIPTVLKGDLNEYLHNKARRNSMELAGKISGQEK